MEKIYKLIDYRHFLILCIVFGVNAVAFSADQVDSTVDRSIRRADGNKVSQRQVNEIVESTDKLIAQYKRELKVIEGLKVYNQLFRKQIQAQNDRKEQLKNAIAENAIVERQIFPLMLSMVDALEQFIELDMPFHLEERRERIANLRQIIGDAEVIGAEKLRKVFEAYQIETDFGGNLDAYTQVLDVEGKQLNVNVLRFGRVSMVYQSEDGKHNAVWDKASRSWASINAAEYRNYIKKGIKIAKKQIAPELFILPVSAPE